jgi:predicted alpha/beta superfamily hydrolase
MMKKIFVLLIISLVSSSMIYIKASNINETIYSAILKEDRQVTINLPKNYTNNTNIKYPVLYLLDGEWNLDFASSLLKRMHLSKAAPEYIVIGINNIDRVRDYTATVNQDPRGPVGKGGGGDNFLDFIELEFIPFVNKKYRTNGFKILAGHSIGGLLVLHSFQSRPHLFQAHFAFSPAVWWAARETLKNTKNFVINTPKLKNYLYMNIGNEGGEMYQVYNELQQTIVKYRPENLVFKSDFFEQEPHGLTLAAGLYNAYRGLFKSQLEQSN